jgi:hypothetical protein
VWKEKCIIRRSHPTTLSCVKVRPFGRRATYRSCLPIWPHPYMCEWRTICQTPPTGEVGRSDYRVGFRASTYRSSNLEETLPAIRIGRSRCSPRPPSVRRATVLRRLLASRFGSRRSICSSMEEGHLQHTPSLDRQFLHSGARFLACHASPVASNRVRSDKINACFLLVVQHGHRTIAGKHRYHGTKSIRHRHEAVRASPDLHEDVRQDLFRPGRIVEHTESAVE